MSTIKIDTTGKTLEQAKDTALRVAVTVDALATSVGRIPIELVNDTCRAFAKSKSIMTQVAVMAQDTSNPARQAKVAELVADLVEDGDVATALSTFADFDTMVPLFAEQINAIAQANMEPIKQEVVNLVRTFKAPVTFNEVASDAIRAIPQLIAMNKALPKPGS